mgnify:CR=1 FL=1
MPERVRPNEIEAAVRVLVRGDRAAAKRFLDYARSTRLDLEQTWVIRNPDGRIGFTALAAPAAGRTAMVFGTRPGSKAEVAIAGRLLAAVAEGCRELGVDLAQALIDPSDALEEAMFIAGGFRRLAQLDYLERPVPRFGTIPSPELPADVDILAWDGNRAELIELLELTYQDTLDCPGLAGLRRTTDILAGHLASGTREPGWWHVLRIDGVPSGTLLFNRGSDGHSIELVYLGLVPTARGRGLGRTLLTYGLAALDGDASRTVVLAVDRANHPAVGLYRRAGFRHSVRRTAMVRPLDETLA